MKTTLWGKLFLMLPILLIVLPFLLAFGFGLWYLFEKGWLLYWLLGALGVLTLTQIYFKLIQSKKFTIFANKPQVTPNGRWSSQDEMVFTQMKAFSQSIDKSTITIDKTLPNRLLELGMEATQEVARHYYPQSSNPALEVTLPHLLKISELVINDMRKEMIEKIPFSHSVTINHFLKVPKMVDLVGDVTSSYRLGRAIVNPLGAVVSELKDRLTSKLFNYSKEELLNWLIDFYILKVARYTIDLYGKNITLNDFDPQSYTTTPTKENKEANAPLKILVVGQINSGKSSLINALFAKEKAIVDSNPVESGINYYNYQSDGKIDTILVDIAGYSSVGIEDKNYRNVVNEIKRADLLILVSAATNAARDLDRALLDNMQAYFDSKPNLKPPLVVCALNQIDKLSPQKQWNPPFDINRPKTPKEKGIKQAMEVVSRELGLSLDAIVPINLHPQREYNIKEALIPLLLDHLSEAQKTQYIRALREYQSKEFWIKLKEQAKATGRLFKNTNSSRHY